MIYCLRFAGLQFSHRLPAIDYRPPSTPSVKGGIRPIPILSERVPNFANTRALTESFETIFSPFSMSVSVETKTKQ